MIVLSSKKIYSRLTVLLSTIIFLYSQAAYSLPITQEWSCAVNHAFAGFGLNAASLPNRLPALIELIRELRAKHIRSPLAPEVKEANVPRDISFTELVKWVEELNKVQNRATGQETVAFGTAMNALGIKQIIASWGFPHQWKVRVTPATEKADGHIADDRIDDFHRLLAAQVELLRNQSVWPEVIEPASELVNRITPPQYGRLLTGFQSRISKIDVAGPGTVFSWENERYLRELVRIGGHLDVISTHAYDALKTHQLASVAPLIDAIPAEWRERPIFVTEYGIDPQLWYPNQPDAADTVPYAVRAAAQTLALLGSGANAVFYWQAQDPPWAKPPYWGLLSKEDKGRPAVDALRTIIQPLEVGDRIASSERRNPPLPLMLAARPGQLVLGVANPNPEPQEYRIDFRNCSTVPITPTKTTVWPADRRLQVQPLSPTSLQITVGGDTVASIEMPR